MTKPISEAALAIIMSMKPGEAAKRIAQARLETVRILNKAKSYSPEFQDTRLIETYEAHVVRLDAVTAQLPTH